MFDNYLTTPLELSRPQLTGLPMNEQTINTREFLRNYKKFIAANETVIIANHGKPEGVFMPYPEWEKKNANKNRSGFFTMEEMEKYTKGLPPGGPTDTSQKIDEILYKNYKSYKNKK